MLKAGADNAATGENAVVVNSRKADVIVGPIGIVIADALFGEITPIMAKAVAQSSAKRILIPINHCDNIVVGVSDLNIKKLIQDVISELQKNDTAALCIYYKYVHDYLPVQFFSVSSFSIFAAASFTQRSAFRLLG